MDDVDGSIVTSTRAPGPGESGSLEQVFYDIGDWLRAIGPWAYVIAPLLMATVAILPIPAEAPAMINGAIFGPGPGIAITWIGSMLGAMVSFELARRLGRPAATRLLGESAIAKADDLVMSAGWGGLLLARFMPLIAFTPLNWGAGLTPITRWRFIWTTAIGIIPGAILFTASGWGMAAALERLPWLAVALAVLLVLWLWWRRRSAAAREATSRAAETSSPAT
ncbi:MAG: VTT domain-containing protein [Gemmatimonadetes bacterium]|nr:VTT domain-containing protein [Gemmatimonadota bacterium]